MANPDREPTSASASKSRCTSPPAELQLLDHGLPRPGTAGRAAFLHSPTHAHHGPRFGRRRRLSAVELQLPQLRRPAQRQRACQGAHPVVDLRQPGSTAPTACCSTPRPTSSSRSARTPRCSRAARVRDTAIAGVVLMDGQIDHATGLFMLRERGTPAAAVVHRPGRGRPDARATRCCGCWATTAAWSATASRSTARRSRCPAWRA